MGQWNSIYFEYEYVFLWKILFESPEIKLSKPNRKYFWEYYIKRTSEISILTQERKYISTISSRNSISKNFLSLYLVQKHSFFQSFFSHYILIFIFPSTLSEWDYHVYVYRIKQAKINCNMNDKHKVNTIILQAYIVSIII